MLAHLGVYRLTEVGNAIIDAAIFEAQTAPPT
jgi:hypothetical protein